MTTITPNERATRAAAKIEDRRAELADATLQTLAELGYARTSLREIANNSPYSHGVLHYYFQDKVDLIIYGVRRYKAQCATRYDGIVATSTSTGELELAFADAMARTLVEDADMHRLWYDLRSQALFDEALRSDVVEIDSLLEDMIWRVLTRWFHLAGRTPSIGRSTAYTALDGTFQRALLRHLTGEADAAETLRDEVVDLVARLTA